MNAIKFSKNMKICYLYSIQRIILDLKKDKDTAIWIMEAFASSMVKLLMKVAWDLHLIDNDKQ